MSTPWDPYIRSHRTDANLSANAWHIVKANGDNDMDLCGAGELPLGVLTNDVGAAATGEKWLDLQMGQLVKVEAGDAVTAGTLVMSNAAGEAIPATDGNYALGTAFTGGADGETIAVQWAPSYLETT